MAYITTEPFIFDCKQCHTPCDGISKGLYNFEHDCTFSEKFEKEFIERINLAGKYKAQKSTQAGYPDIELYGTYNTLDKFVEIKVQQRTFMSVEKYLPGSGLKPSETVALNRSDLLRYFDIEEQTRLPVIIAWFLLNRLCLVQAHEARLFYQKLSVLRSIYEHAGETRTFKRQSGEGDVVNGVHKGVTLNYHFSLRELQVAHW